MKKSYYFGFVFIFIFLYLQAPTEVNAYSKHGPIYVFIEGKEPDFKNKPIIQNGTTLVEFRPVFELLGLKVSWDSTTKTITGEREKLKITLKLNERIAYVNNRKVILSQSPEIINGRTIVPLRFIAESCGKNVYWDANTRMIVIKDGNFVEANFELEENDLNLHFKQNLYNGILGPFNVNQRGISLAALVNKYGFPNTRHDGTPYSDDIPFVSYGDYIIYYLGTKGENYLVSPVVTDIQILLPASTTNQDIITLFGDDYKIYYGMYLGLIYDLGEHSILIKTSGTDYQSYSYMLGFLLQ